MKKVLILVVSSVQEPYRKMIETSLNTWDSVDYNNVETLFYSGIPYIKEFRHKLLQLPYEETYSNMGHKMLDAFQFALDSREFDYIARVNSSCYVDKAKLLEYCQTLDETNVFNCIEVEGKPRWAWGGGQFIFSKDVIQKIVDNEGKFDHSVMEDVAVSRLVDNLGVPYSAGKACSINENEKGGWTLIGYGSESIEFTNFEEIKKLGHHFYRVKIDRDRSVDAYLMSELFKTLS